MFWRCLQDCSIELTVGRRYGLIGQNGSGKTNFLQALAFREVCRRCEYLCGQLMMRAVAHGRESWRISSRKL